MATTQGSVNAIKLLNENDPKAIHPDNPEAASNIMALARRRGGFSQRSAKWMFGTACPAVSGMRSGSGITRMQYKRRQRASGNMQACPDEGRIRDYDGRM